MDFLRQWFGQPVDWWHLGLWLTVISYGLGLVLMYVVIIWLPEDYLCDESRWYQRLRRHHPLVYWLIFLLKNALGLMLVAAGVVMLFLPGQGVLTLTLGILLLDFPGKHAVVSRMLSRPSVLRLINRIRQWAGRPPLRLPQRK